MNVSSSHTSDVYDDESNNDNNDVIIPDQQVSKRVSNYGDSLLQYPHTNHLLAILQRRNNKKYT